MSEPLVAGKRSNLASSACPVKAVPASNRENNSFCSFYLGLIFVGNKVRYYSSDYELELISFSVDYY